MLDDLLCLPLHLLLLLFDFHFLFLFCVNMLLSSLSPLCALCLRVFCFMRNICVFCLIGCTVAHTHTHTCTGNNSTVLAHIVLWIRLLHTIAFPCVSFFSDDLFFLVIFFYVILYALCIIIHT